MLEYKLRWNIPPVNINLKNSFRIPLLRSEIKLPMDRLMKYGRRCNLIMRDMIAVLNLQMGASQIAFNEIIEEKVTFIY